MSTYTSAPSGARTALRTERHSLREPVVIWLTGLSGAGKSTIAASLKTRLGLRGVTTCVLDGDELRAGLSRDLGFSSADRRENIRRAAEVARLVVNAGVSVIAALISPLRADRDRVRQEVFGDAFVEVFVKAPLAVCQQRDVKGLYALARAGAVQDFTGVGSEYEEPLNPELTVDTTVLSVDECVNAVMLHLDGQTSSWMVAHSN